MWGIAPYDVLATGLKDRNVGALMRPRIRFAADISTP
jgi:hypothetical protein